MRAAVFAAGVLALAGVLLARPAQAAQGMNLRWDRCYGDGGIQNRTFACDTNAGGEVLVCSFVLNEPLAQVSGNEIVIDVLSEADPIPAWWDFKNVGTCRQNSLSMNITANPLDVVCVDWTAGGATGGLGFYGSELGPIDPSLGTRHRRLKIALAMSPTALQDLAADTEYFSCNITINHAKTVGTGACAGCTSSVCMVLNQLRVTTPIPENDRTLGVGTSPGSNMVQWQGAGANCNLVPVKRSTWGAVKGLYR